MNTRHRLAANVALALTAALVLLLSPIGSPRASAHTPGDVLIAGDSTWMYWRDPVAPAAGWADLGYDDSSWSVGDAPFGYGSRLGTAEVTTRLPDYPNQVLTTYFRHAFQVDLGERPELAFETWADDGIVVYVNGVEAGRQNVSPSRTQVTHNAIWAVGAPRTAAALSRPVTITIDPELLQDGENVLTAVVIANWRASFDVTFGGELTVERSHGSDVPGGDGNAVPEPPAAGGQMPSGDVVPFGARWEYYRSTVGPSPDWQYSTASSGWPSASAPFGFGRAADAATTSLSAAGNPLSTYFRHQFTIGSASEGLLVEGATFSTWADDGVIAYVNGHEIGRHRVADDAAGHHDETWATAAPSTASARAEVTTFAVPGDYLQQGANVLAVQVISNHRTTADISFDGRLAPGGGGEVGSTAGPDESWELVWSDEFDGNSLDSSNWTAYDNSSYGDGNLESACLMDRPENLSVRDGHLYLTAQYEPTPIQCGWNDLRYPNGRTYTSAQIMSRDKVTFVYGRVEIRARLPIAQGQSQGLWPAFWLRTTEGLGEVDILEALGSGVGDSWQAGTVYHSLHRETTNTNNSVRTSYQLPMGGDMSAGFHTYAVEWERDEIRFFVDGVMSGRYTADEVSWLAETFNEKEFFIRLNLAVGGRWPGYVDESTVLPASYVIDYVRLYQPR
ncbi:glycoside hydrolase family 16 protein [Pseudactinotalea sp.]|uniref:glycoside hydrolase family 16 protein n=1 Tax=Pseudactinotalea sp. TaxID=1926260 RepID=UPI003B3A4A04